MRMTQTQAATSIYDTSANDFQAEWLNVLKTSNEQRNILHLLKLRSFL
jgi:hypothetical protein